MPLPAFLIPALIGGASAGLNYLRQRQEHDRAQREAKNDPMLAIREALIGEFVRQNPAEKADPVRSRVLNSFLQPRSSVPNASVWDSLMEGITSGAETYGQMRSMGSRGGRSSSSSRGSSDPGQTACPPGQVHVPGFGCM